MSIRIYLSASTQSGNIGVLNYGTEEERMQFLADLVQEYIKKGQGDFTIFRNSKGMSLRQTIDDSNSKNVNLHLSIHSNAGGGDGTEVYYYYKNPQTNGKGQKLAQIVYDAVAPITIGADNGVRPDNVLYDIGLAELRETNAPAALIEIMFHDNKTDVTDYLSKIDRIAMALAKSFYTFYGFTYTETENFSIEELIVNALYSKNIITDKAYWSSHIEGNAVTLTKKDLIYVLKKLLGL